MSRVDIRIHCQGHPQGDLVITRDHATCGDIKDGVSIGFDRRAGWVMSWEDFELAYQSLKVARSDEMIRASRGGK